MHPTDPIQTLIAAFGQLPGVGEKTATRLTLHILRSPPELAQNLAAALLKVTQSVHRCPRCHNLTSDEHCAICADPRRDDATLCVVETVADLWALERGGFFHGRYHVLHGAIAPIDGIGPDQLTIGELIERVQSEQPREVILATNSDVNGETTALYLAKLLGELGVSVSRIATGIPTGGGLEYVDRATLEMALTYRRDMRRS